MKKHKDNIKEEEIVKEYMSYTEAVINRRQGEITIYDHIRKRYRNYK